MSKRREEAILKQLEVCDFLTTEQAMKLVGGSAATIRRVFIKLAESNLARRVHGGLRRLPVGGDGSLPFVMRERWFDDEKARLAARAMEFLPKGGVAFIHGGSTTCKLAQHIRSGTIITDSINVCGSFMQRFPSGGGPEILVAGGTLDVKGDALYGPRTEAALREYRADVCFFSTRGMDDEGVLDTADTLVATVRLMMRNSALRVLLADHSKFRKFGLTQMAPWENVDVLVTSDHPENHHWFDTIKNHGVKIVFA
ncbi:DeoR family fructose operon transcriptional repressor [Ereboglobus sp. PH5-10]|uniref:DeoR/GlpR family DNA-binding transcription regulator n=1 Tax=Ereboglobus sp. PH5-10 TaxID=2940629 RepID=UPI0024055CB0|nr:DeoR/GlpR family DNA-binding transcription regulator [Ereboglobus sp. PH5-10]MDF9827211.1 DeoR family fructose operon transcriptional repressor [Ereboglobus sp. PH5-10]